MLHLLKIGINPSRIYGLDILRAAAILFVVVAYGEILLPPNWGVLHKLLVFDGVSMFFVLSGFLIGGILIKLLDNKEPTNGLLLHFWLRRWFRTLPNYFLVLLILIALYTTYAPNFSILSIGKYFVFAQNLVSPHPDFFAEAWSISIEEWFYLITPICLFSMIRFFKVEPKHAVLLVAIAILLLAAAFRYHRFLTIEISSIYQWDKVFRKQVFTRLDSLMFGVICAYVQYYHKRIWLARKRTLLLIGLSIFVLTKALELSEWASPGGFYNCVLSFVVTALATASLLPYLSTLKSGKGYLYRGLTTISLISYSMYLLHLSVVQVFIVHRIPWSELIENEHLMTFLRYSTYWILTLLVSILTYKYYELPVMKLRDSKRVKNLLSSPQKRR